MKYKKGDRVRVLPFSEISSEEASGHMTLVSCYGIRKDVIDRASTQDFWVVSVAGSSTVCLEGSPYSWLNCMLRPYEEEETLETPESDAIFTSLFGVEVEVTR